MQDASEHRTDSSGRAVADIEIRAALQTVLASTAFERAERASAFLRYVVDETLAGRGDRLKAYSIATDVYERDETFDPRSDTIVRVEAGRLRRRLKDYYAAEGQDDPVRIDLPVGGYEPAFEARDRPAAAAPSEPIQDPVHDDTEGSPGPRTRPWFLPLVAAICVTVAVLLLAGWTLRKPEPAVLSAVQPKIAVLPFVNASGDPEDSYLANGFTTELVIAMAGYDHMVIVSRATSAKYEGTDPRDIGRDLAAQYVIQGSIHNDGTNLRISSDLTETGSANVVWADTFQVPLQSADGFSTAAQVAEQIAKAVAKPHGVVFDKTLADVTGAASEYSSYQCILKAYDYDRQRGADYHALVRSCLEETVKREPELSVAWVLLSAAYLDEHRNSYNPEPGSLDRALAAALRAVELSPEDPQSHWALALVHYFHKDRQAFEASAERALDLGANDADMIANLGFKLIVSGIDWERGFELLEQAIGMSPKHPPMWHAPITLYHYHSENYDDALLAANSFNIPKLYMSHMLRAMVLGQLGQQEDARSSLEEALRLKPNLATDLRADLSRRSVPDDMIEKMVDGLGKAGLEIPEQ